MVTVTIQSLIGPSQGQVEVLVPESSKILGAKMREGQVEIFVEVPLIYPRVKDGNEGNLGPLEDNLKIMLISTGYQFNVPGPHLATAFDHENDMEVHIYKVDR